MNIKPKTVTVGALALLMTAACGTKEPAETAAPEPVAQVATVALSKQTMTETITAYGVVLPFSDKLQTISLPYNSEIEQINVTDGQWVQAGEALLTVKSAPDADLQLTQAQEELAAAEEESQLMQQRVKLKLGTQQDLVNAQLRASQAKVMTNNLVQRGIGKSRVLKAERAGMVYLVSVQQGQQVAAGSPLLQLLGENQQVVRLGIEPEDFNGLQAKQTVLIKPVGRPAEAVKGRIETIARQIDPLTRLINVLVRPEPNQSLLINDFVQAEVILSSVSTLVAPRQAVLPEGTAYSLFTVSNGHAVKHNVQLGLANDRQVEVIADDVHEQDEIVVLGNYELADGMAVKVQQP